jgi:hypothetical protein
VLQASDDPVYQFIDEVVLQASDNPVYQFIGSKIEFSVMMPSFWASIVKDYVTLLIG